MGCQIDPLNIAAGVANFNIFVSDQLQMSAKEIERGDSSGWNYCWIIPCNILLAMAELTIYPLFILADLVMGVALKLISCCTDDFCDVDPDSAANAFFKLALLQLTDFPINIFARVFVPTAEIEILDPCLEACEEICQEEC